MDIHIVTQGETIYSIANEYGTSPQRLIVDNGLTGLNNLVIGQSLIILKPSITHTVTQGESIYSIASLYGIDTLRLILNNPTLIFNTNIIPGEILTIEFDNQSNRNVETYGYIYPFINRDLLELQSAYSTRMAVFSYGFTQQGELIPINDDAVLSTFERWQTQPIMLLSSITEEGTFQNEKATVLFNNIEVQNNVISNMLEVMREKGYIGVDLDFEYIDPKDRDAYVAFVENVTTQMNQNGYSVNVDLAPKNSDNQRGTLYEGHDYAALGNAANTVLLMTYEWGYTYGPPMAVAPINKVREVVEYGVSKIDNTKIYMGIPNYGYDWLLPYVQGESKARSIGNEEAIRIAQRYGAIISFDDVAASPYFNYIDESGREHEVWFEDVRSIIAKYDLIDEFQLLGGGYWNLMRSFIQNWSYVNSQYRIAKI